MKKQKISAKTVALMAMMIALAMIFSYVETMIPINFGIPGRKTGTCQFGHCGGNLPFWWETGIFDFHCANLLKRIHVWKSGIHHVQSGGRSAQSGSHAPFEKNRQAVDPCGQCHGWYLPQHWTVDRGNACGGKSEADFLCSGTSDFRISYRSADRYRMQSDSSSSQTGIRICKITSCLPGA